MLICVTNAYYDRGIFSHLNRKIVLRNQLVPSTIALDRRGSFRPHFHAPALCRCTVDVSLSFLYLSLYVPGDPPGPRGSAPLRGRTATATTFEIKLSESFVAIPFSTYMYISRLTISMYIDTVRYGIRF